MAKSKKENKLSEYQLKFLESFLSVSKEFYCHAEDDDTHLGDFCDSDFDNPYLPMINPDDGIFYEIPTAEGLQEEKLEILEILEARAIKASDTRLPLETVPEEANMEVLATSAIEQYPILPGIPSQPTNQSLQMVEDNRADCIAKLSEEPALENCTTENFSPSNIKKRKPLTGSQIGKVSFFKQSNPEDTTPNTTELKQTNRS